MSQSTAKHKNGIKYIIYKAQSLKNSKTMNIFMRNKWMNKRNANESKNWKYIYSPHKKTTKTIEETMTASNLMRTQSERTNTPE